MSERIDLDELDKVCRAAELDDERDWIAGTAVVGGLIDRIRELEAQARRTVDANGLTVEDELIALSALLEKGTVRRG